MKIHLEEMEGSRHPVIVLDDEPQVQRRNLHATFCTMFRGAKTCTLAA